MRASSRCFNAAFEVTHAPTWAPARLKVLVAATQVIRRSAISGAAVIVGVCLAPSKTRSQWISSDTRIRSCSTQNARQRAKLVGRPDGAAGIVRAAKKNDLRARRQLGAQRIEIHRVAAIGLDKLRIEDAPLIGDDDPAEGVIGRRKDDDLVAGLAHRLQDQTEPGDDAGRRAHPARIDPQAMAARHPIGERRRPAAGVGVIAVDGALDLGGRAPPSRPAARRNPCPPPTSAIASGDLMPDRRGHIVPLGSVRAAALDDAVEIEHETSAPKGWRESTPVRNRPENPSSRRRIPAASRSATDARYGRRRCSRSRPRGPVRHWRRRWRGRPSPADRSRSA